MSGRRDYAAADFNRVSGIGRNLTIQVLEYLDRIGITQRHGDHHQLCARVRIRGLAVNRNAVITTDIVLLGGGHAHVHVVRAFAQRPLPGVRLTLVSRDLETPYSGMLPGVIAGTYERDGAHIDLVRLAAVTGTRLIHAEAIGVDRARRAGYRRTPADGLRHPVDRRRHHADLVSIIGAAQHGIAVKPIGASWTSSKIILRARCRAGTVRRIALVGGGAGGVELLLSLRTRLRADAVHDGRAPDLSFALVTAEALLATHNGRVRRGSTNISRRPASWCTCIAR